MATNLNKFRGVYEGTKAAFVENAKATADEQDLIVFITGDGTEGSSCIYAKGTFFADFKSLIAALAFVKGIHVGDTDYNAAQGGGYIKFEAADPATVVYVENNGVKIGLSSTFVTKVNNTATQLATVMNDYLTSADKTALEQLIATAKAEAKAEVIGQSGDASSADTLYGVRKYVDEKTADIASGEAFTTLKDRVDNIEGDYLKNADKTELQDNIDDVAERVKAIEDDYLVEADKTELANRITTEAPVTITEAAGSGDVLKTYTFTQNGKTIGTINLAKDLVVSSGAVVMHEGVKCLELTLTSGDVVHIPVTDLVDVYTAGDYVTISEDNVVSVDKAGIIEGLATETYVGEQIAAEVTRSNEYTDDAIAAEVDRANKLYATQTELSDGVAEAKSHAETKASEAQAAAEATAAELATAAKNEANSATDTKLADYYKKTETYSQTEVNAMFEWVTL